MEGVAREGVARESLTSMPSVGHTLFIISLNSNALELSLLVDTMTQFFSGTYTCTHAHT